ncbi:MAG: hypothetical protein UHH95_05370 [Oscillospiraceae bacterium]|nr:hypothetical protein [Oscillospiraceae bacterium]
MRNNNFWVNSLKTMMMSGFASIISFMLNCLIVVVAANTFFGSDAVVTRVFMQVVGIFVQLIFTYGVLWECGYTDKQRVNLNEGSYSKYRGLLIGFFAAIPYYLMAIAMMLMSFDVIPDITGLLRACSSQFWGIYTFLLPVKTTHIELDTQGIAQSIATPAQAISAVFVPTIIPILAHFSYTMGRKGFSFGERLLLKRTKK